MKKAKFLSKSRFRLAHECPTKLFYTGKSDYADKSSHDEFLRSLAEGGFQTGELAKRYYPGGTEITTLDYADSVNETNALLKQSDAIIYEAAACAMDCFIRADIVVKESNDVQLIEVKSKSFNPKKDKFLGKKGDILAKWDPYLYDVAFQTYVFRKAHPSLNVTPFLYLVDPTAECPTDGLNQKFLLEEKKGRTGVRVTSEPSSADLSVPLMKLHDVSSIVDKIISSPQFEKEVLRWATAYKEDAKLAPTLSSECKTCQFRASPDERGDGLKCGWTECWTEVLGAGADLQSPSVLEIWDHKDKDSFLEQGKYFIADLQDGDIEIKPVDEPGLSRTQRQWMQVVKTRDHDDTPFVDFANLEIEMAQWIFPLHFIDFETTAVAIPFHAGSRPYQGVAFQFSHHVVEENGSIRHAGQYLHVKPGEFPNFEFIRKLKSELDKDYGTIFRFAAHENTYLNFILDQLEGSSEPDRHELIKFIQSISKPTGNSERDWMPNREMVDFLKVLKRYYYDPRMGGSNSLKALLPAILSRSEYLQEKYSKPIYGTEIPSLNFKSHTWVLRGESGDVIDPYKRLPAIMADQDKGATDFIFKSDRLSNGGAAMMAWARMQFTEMGDAERAALANALLKYCELDTFAMVMVYEYWRELVSKWRKAGGEERVSKARPSKLSGSRY